MALLSRPESIHDVDDIEAHCRATIRRALGRNGGYLTIDQSEELLAYLLTIAFRLKDRYDPTRSTLSFSTFCSQICGKRVVDWYRKELGDSRYGKRVQPLSLEALASSTGRTIAEVIGTTSDSEYEEVITRVSFAV